MGVLDKKTLNRSLRAARVRAKVTGTAERPRLTVTISNKHISASKTCGSSSDYSNSIFILFDV